MTKQDLLTAVCAHAQGSGIPQQELDKMLEYYAEMIDEAMEEGVSEEEAVAGLGSWSEIIGQINASCGQSQTDPSDSLPAAAPEKTGSDQTEAQTPVRNGRVSLQIWALILLIITSPIWAVLILVLVCVLFAVVCTVVSVLFAAAVTAAALVIAAVVCIPAAVVILFRGSAVSCLVTLSCGMICFGCAMLFWVSCRALVWLFVRLIQLIQSGWRRIFKKQA
ncbi:MAG: DUF1700 domain-containing protein [Eubacteriales bacterium]